MSWQTSDFWKEHTVRKVQERPDKQKDVHLEQRSLLAEMREKYA